MENNNDLEIVGSEPIDKVEDAVDSQVTESQTELPVETKTETTEIKEVKDIGIYKNVDTNILDKDKLISIPKIPYEQYYLYLNNVNEISKEYMENNVNASLSSYFNVSGMNGTVSKATANGFSIDSPSVLSREDVIVGPRKVTRAGKTKESRIKSIVSNVISGGQTVQFPLNNSGFQITMTHPGTNELFECRKTLRNLSIDSEINVGGLLYNSTKTRLINHIIDFALEYIQDTTLDFDKGNLGKRDFKQIKKYIDPMDYPFIIACIGMTLTPQGNTTSITCVNTTVIEETKDSKGKIIKKPKCDYVATATLSVKDTIRLKDERYTETMFDIISRVKSKTVSLDDLKTYQKERMKNMSKDLDKITFSGNGESITFNLYNPNYENYEKVSLAYVTNLENILYGLGDADNEDRDKTLSDLLELNKLSGFTHYLKSVDIGSDTIDLVNYVDEEEFNKNISEVTEILSEFNSDNLTMNIYLEKLFEFISYSNIASLAVNNFQCPKCKEKQNKDDELIWLDPLNYFLEILDYRFTNILE